MVKSSSGRGSAAKTWRKSGLPNRGPAAQIGLVDREAELELRSRLHIRLGTDAAERCRRAGFARFVGLDCLKHARQLGKSMIDDLNVTMHNTIFRFGRMLLGGIKSDWHLYRASESSFKNSTITMCQTVKAVAKATPFIDADSDERLLVHICYSPMRKWAKDSFNIFGQCFIGCPRKQKSDVMVLNDHCAELMSIEVPIDPSRILEPESEASYICNHPVFFGTS
nr:protein odr-4 homolog [Ipomoea batatas]